MPPTYVPVIDFHIHLRGGMTPRKALDRQAVTGINSGVLRNIGKGWPIETDGQLREHLDSVTGMPLFVGVQVNDRDWMQRHSPDLLQQLDYVLADTMIMPMPDDDSEPVKLWLADQYEIDDPAAWMERVHAAHTSRVGRADHDSGEPHLSARLPWKASTTSYGPMHECGRSFRRPSRTTSRWRSMLQPLAA